MNNLKNLFESVEINFNIYESNKNPKTANAYKKALLSLSREVNSLKKPLTASKPKKPKSLVSNGLTEVKQPKQEPLMVPVELPINTAEVLNPTSTQKKKSKRKAAKVSQ